MADGKGIQGHRRSVAALESRRRSPREAHAGPGSRGLGAEARHARPRVEKRRRPDVADLHDLGTRDRGADRTAWQRELRLARSQTAWREREMKRLLALLVALTITAGCGYVQMRPKGGGQPTPYTPR